MKVEYRASSKTVNVLVLQWMDFSMIQMLYRPLGRVIADELRGSVEEISQLLIFDEEDYLHAEVPTDEGQPDTDGSEVSQRRRKQKRRGMAGKRKGGGGRRKNSVWQ